MLDTDKLHKELNDIIRLKEREIKLNKAIDRIDAIICGHIETRLQYAYQNEDTSINADQAQILNNNKDELKKSLYEFADAVYSIQSTKKNTATKEPQDRPLIMILVLVATMFFVIWFKLETQETAKQPAACGDYDVSVYPDRWEFDSKK